MTRLYNQYDIGVIFQGTENLGSYFIRLYPKLNFFLQIRTLFTFNINDSPFTIFPTNNRRGTVRVITRDTFEGS